MVNEKMIYNNLIHNKNIINTFSSYIKNDNLPHAIIFHGSKGVGKFSHAIELCNMLLSENADLNVVEKKIRNNQHENINYILPLPKSKSISKNDSALNAVSKSDLEHIQSEIKHKLTNPYHKISIKKANTILVNSIRDLKKKISLSNFNDKWNIHMILEAEKLCFPRTESANALLKILEEPNEKNLFILITTNISNILETITSRCSKIYFPKLNQKDIMHLVVNEYNLDEDKAKMISNLCNGNATSANKIAGEFESYIKKINLLINLIFSYDLNKWQQIFSKLKDTNEIIFLLDLLNIYFNDIIIFKEIQKKEKLKFSYLTNQIIECSKKYNTTQLNQIINKINDTKKNFTKNIYFPLLMTTLYLEINQILINNSKEQMDYTNENKLYSINE
jgi:DNA polymerase III gamma/tau subunit